MKTGAATAFITTLLLCLVATGPAKQPVAKTLSKNIVIGFRPDLLFSQLRLRVAARPARTALGTHYWIGPRRQGASEFVGVGIFESVAEAHAKFAQTRRQRSMPVRPDQFQIGDESICFGRTVRPLSNGLVLVRRLNVIFETRWEGDTQSAIAFARRIDGLIQRDASTFPRGSRDVRIIAQNAEVVVAAKVLSIDEETRIAKLGIRAYILKIAVSEVMKGEMVGDTVLFTVPFHPPYTHHADAKTPANVGSTYVFFLVDPKIGINGFRRWTVVGMRPYSASVRDRLRQ